MTNNKTKKQQQEPFEDNFERMVNPVKKLLAGIKKGDVSSPIEEASYESNEFNSTEQEHGQTSATSLNFTQVKSTQVEDAQVKSTRVLFTQPNTEKTLDFEKSTQVKSTQVDIESNFTKVDNDILDRAMLDMSPSEFIIYLKLYRLSYGFHLNYCRIGRGKLTRITNLNSDKTVQVALNGLEDKGFIKPLQEKGSNPKGTQYRVYLPQEINNPDSATRIKFTQVETTQVEKSDYSSNIHSTNSSRSYSSKNFHDHDLKDHDHDQKKEKDLHQNETMTIYKSLTGNKWSKADETAYQRIKGIPLAQIETTIQTVMKRAPQRPGSLAYFIKEIISPTKVNPASRSNRKKQLTRIIQQVKDANIGRNGYLISDFAADVKDACLRENVDFDNDLFNEIIG